MLKPCEIGLARATALRRPTGFGASCFHTAKINGFLPRLDTTIGGGLVTLETVKVIHYRHETGDKMGGDKT